MYSDGRTIAYEYDAEEKITKITDSTDGVTEYEYDALSQLVSETVNGVTTKFVYDSCGNILEKGVVDDDGGNPTSYLVSLMLMTLPTPLLRDIIYSLIVKMNQSTRKTHMATVRATKHIESD